MTLHSVHWRRRGSCRKRRFSACSRHTQIGSWWDTITASWPSASRRASSTAAHIRAATSEYGSPHDGRKGLSRCRQTDGVRTRLRPMVKRLPSKTFVDSMTLSSRTGVTPRTFASGAAVCCARSSGEETMWVMSRSPIRSATRSAIACPRSESTNPGARP